MKKIVAAAAFAALSSIANSAIVRVDIFGTGYIADLENVPFHAWMAIDTVREAEINANGGATDGWYGGPGLLSYGFTIGGQTCSTGWGPHTQGGMSVSSSGFAGGAAVLFQDHCTLQLQVNFGTDPVRPFDGLPLPGSSIAGYGLFDPLGFMPATLTGYVTRVDGVIVGASDPWLIPEPASLALFGAGLAALIGLRRRRKA